MDLALGQNHCFWPQMVARRRRWLVFPTPHSEHPCLLTGGSDLPWVLKQILNRCCGFSLGNAHLHPSPAGRSCWEGTLVPAPCPKLYWDPKPDFQGTAEPWCRSPEGFLSQVPPGAEAMPSLQEHAPLWGHAPSRPEAKRTLDFQKLGELRALWLGDLSPVCFHPPPIHQVPRASA